MSNSVPYTIVIHNPNNSDTATLQEAYAISLAGPQKPDFSARARRLFDHTNMTRSWNTTFDQCEVQVHEGRWVGSPDSVID